MEIMIKNVADILIPSGWKVFPIFTAVNFDSALHKNPLEFNPWRWFVSISILPLVQYVNQTPHLDINLYY